MAEPGTTVNGWVRQTEEADLGQVYVLTERMVDANARLKRDC